MDSLLHKLMCLSIITSATFYVTNQFQDKEVLWLTEGRKLAKLIGTANTCDLPVSCTEHSVNRNTQG